MSRHPASEQRDQVVLLWPRSAHPLGAGASVLTPRIAAGHLHRGRVEEVVPALRRRSVATWFVSRSLRDGDSAVKTAKPGHGQKSEGSGGRGTI